MLIYHRTSSEDSALLFFGGAFFAATGFFAAATFLAGAGFWTTGIAADRAAAAAVALEPLWKGESRMRCTLLCMTQGLLERVCENKSRC